MIKRIISCAAALCMAFGAAAYLPGSFSPQSGIMAQAETYGDFEYRLLDDDSVEISKYNGSDTKVIIPSKISGKMVSGIEGDAFIDNYYIENIEEIVFPDTLKEISSFACEGCYNLKKINLPNDCTMIGQYAFYGTSLEELFIPADFSANLNEDAFPWDTMKVVIDENNKNYSIKNNCLCHKCIIDDEEYTVLSVYFPNDDQHELLIPNEVTYIGSDVFQRAFNLTKIVIGPNVKNCSVDSFFRMASSIRRVEVDPENHFIRTENNCLIVPNGESQVMIGVLDRDMKGTLTVPDNVDWIDGGAFSYCTNLTGIIIPNSVYYFGLEAFENCTSLTSITIPDSVTGINYRMFSFCESLTSITIPDSVTSIGDYAFDDCSSLTSITIPNSVTSIGEGAFYGCTSLASITIPDSVTSIGENAFDECDKLTVKCRKDTYAYEFLIQNDKFDSVGEDDEYCLFKYHHEHTYESDSAKITTCTEDGWVHYICECGESYTEIISAPGHDYYEIYVEPTCTEKGHTEYTCSECGDTYTEEIPATGHKYTEKVVAPTYDAQGYTEHTCSVCGDSYKDNYTDKLERPHEHSYTSKVTTPATCKEEGVKTYTCSCGDTYTESIPKLTTHTFGNWTTTKAATCTAEGTQTRTCSVCGKTETKTIAKTAHKFTTKVVAPTYTAQGYTLHTCSVCGNSYKTYKAKLTRTSIAKAAVTGISNKTYTGKSIAPAPVVKLGTKTLKKGTDYTVTYKNNKNVGKATVTITGKGAYTGTITKTFKIYPKATSITKLTSPKKKQLKATFKKVSGVTGYQVVYSTSKKFTKATTKTATVKTTSKTVKSLKKGKTYYVKVRTFKTVGGVKYYGAYSAVKKIKVK